jgi:hypothetical protein
MNILKQSKDDLDLIHFQNGTKENKVKRRHSCNASFLTSDSSNHTSNRAYSPTEGSNGSHCPEKGSNRSHSPAEGSNRSYSPTEEELANHYIVYHSPSEPYVRVITEYYETFRPIFGSFWSTSEGIAIENMARINTERQKSDKQGNVQNEENDSISLDDSSSASNDDSLTLQSIQKHDSISNDDSSIQKNDDSSIQRNDSSATQSIQSPEFEYSPHTPEGPPPSNLANIPIHHPVPSLGQMNVSSDDSVFGESKFDFVDSPFSFISTGSDDVFMENSPSQQNTSFHPSGSAPHPISISSASSGAASSGAASSGSLIDSISDIFMDSNADESSENDVFMDDLDIGINNSNDSDDSDENDVSMEDDDLDENDVSMDDDLFQLSASQDILATRKRSSEMALPPAKRTCMRHLSENVSSPCFIFFQIIQKYCINIKMIKIYTKISK